MAVLNKAWGSLDQVAAKDGAVVTGEGEEAGAEPSAPRLLEKPLFIYVTDGAEVEDFDKIEKVVLMDDKVCIGMWAFDCVKMTPEKVAADPILSEEWKGDDRGFIFVSRDMEKVDVIGMKKMSAKTVFKTMKKHAKASYKSNFEKSVKDVLKVLTEFDKINNERRVLADKEKRASEKEDKKALKDIAKDREELEKAEKEMNAKRDELLKFEPKEMKA